MAREEYILDAQGKNLVRILPKSWRNFRGLDTKYSRGKIFFNVAIEATVVKDIIRQRIQC